MSNHKGAKAPQSNAERQAKLKKSRLAAGLVRVEVYSTQEQKAKILEFVAQMKAEGEK